jgi:hypothetical protein
MISRGRCSRRGFAVPGTWWKRAKMGAPIGTMPYRVFEMLFKSPLTECGLELFSKDWERAQQTLGSSTEAAGGREGFR